LFQSLASELTSPNNQNHSSNESDIAASDFVASIASACRLSTRKTTILKWKYEITGLDPIQKHKKAQEIVIRA
jgi:hypothetical protein